MAGSKIKLNITKDSIRKFAQINLGLIICAIGVSCFLWPTSFVTGGASGLAILLERICPKISNAIFLYIINISLLLVSLPILGKDYFIKTLYATLMLPTLVMFGEFIVKKADLFDTFKNLDSWLIVSFGAVAMGVGSGLSLAANGSTGGLDVLQSIGFKTFHIPYSVSNYIINGLIIAGGMINSGLGNGGLQKGLEAVVFLFVTGLVVDMTTFAGFNKRAVFIKTSRIDEVREMIMYRINRGCTLVKAQGGYTLDEGDMLVCVCMSREYLMLRKYIDEIDPNSFVFVTRATEVRGSGFSKNTDIRKANIQKLKEKK